MIDIASYREQWFCDCLQKRKLFSSARFAEQHWESILGVVCGDDTSSLSLGHDLRKMLLEISECADSSTFHLGICPNIQSHSVLAVPLREWLTGRLLSHVGWCDAGVLGLQRSPPDKFFSAARGLRAVVAGPPHLRGLAKRHTCMAGSHLFEDVLFIDAPERGIFNVYPIILQRTAATLARMQHESSQPVLVTLSCGVASPLIAWSLYKSFGRFAFVLDVGSMYDKVIESPVQSKAWSVAGSFEGH